VSFLLIIQSGLVQEVSALEELMLHMHAQGLITTADVITGLATFTVQLEDIR
jgi:hypothetical protein